MVRNTSIIAVCVFSILLVWFGQTKGQPQASTRRLLHDLLSGYPGNQVRPVHNASSAVIVHHALSLLEILNFNRNNGLITLKIWEQMTWTDEWLIWERDEYDGIYRLKVLNDETVNFWTPDVTLYNNAEAKLNRDESVRRVIFSDGDVMWVPQSVISVTCHEWTDQSDFGQTWYCPIKYGSWVYDGFELDLHPVYDRNTVDLSYYIHKPKYQILNTTVQRDVKYYECCEEPYITINNDLYISVAPRGHSD